MPNGPANDHFTRGGISLSSAPAALAPSTANVPAKASAQIFLMTLIASSPPAPSSFRHRGAARDCRTGCPVPDRLADGSRQRVRPLDQAEQREDDEEVNEVPGGEDARRQHVTALRRLRAEPAKPHAHRREDPEELPVK